MHCRHYFDSIQLVAEPVKFTAAQLLSLSLAANPMLLTLAVIVAKDWRQPTLHFRKLHAFSHGIALDLVFADGLNSKIMGFRMSEIKAAH